MKFKTCFPFFGGKLKEKKKEKNLSLGVFAGNLETISLLLWGSEIG